MKNLHHYWFRMSRDHKLLPSIYQTMNV